jgi:hypothetical protein
MYGSAVYMYNLKLPASLMTYELGEKVRLSSNQMNVLCILKHNVFLKMMKSKQNVQIKHKVLSTHIPCF